MAKRDTERIIARMKEKNPGIRVEQGTSHWLVYARDGRLAGILPYQQKIEGISANLRSQFRRAGIRVGKYG